MKSYLSLLILVFSMNTSLAGSTTPTSKIKNLALFSSGHAVNIHTFSEHINPDNCTSNNFYAIEDIDDTTFDRKLSILQTALVAGNNVRFWVHGCTQKNYWGKTYPVIRMITIDSNITD